MKDQEEMFRLACALGVLLFAGFSLVYVSCNWPSGNGNNIELTDPDPDPVTTLTAPLGGETLAGMANITWTTVDKKKGSR